MSAHYTDDENLLVNEVKQNRKAKSGKRLIRYFSIVILLAGTLVLIALSPVCTIRQITVEGNQHYKSEDIVGITNIIPGSNGFKTLCRYAANIFTFRFIDDEKVILRTFPYVKDIRINYVIPDKVKIRVTERIPAGIAANNGINVLIDGEGYVLDIVSKVSSYNLPLIKGVKFDRYELGQALKPSNPTSLSSAFTLLSAIGKLDQDADLKLYGLVNYVDASNPQKVTFGLDSRITVIIGDLHELDYRLSFLKQIYIKNLKKDDKGVLDFSSGNDPSFKPET